MDNFDNTSRRTYRQSHGTLGVLNEWPSCRSTDSVWVSYNCDKHDSDVLTQAVHSAPCSNLYLVSLSRKSDTHYPDIRPVHTGRLYGPYTYGCRKMHPCVRTVCTGRTHGCIFRHPYVRAVHMNVKKCTRIRVVRIDL